ncbi:hypothetical protein IR083_01055 [Dysgonomonas sp. GY75]|uniref:hypothetical protein n=1 Tax=Dysgonomonas sp. GY75 TaxID=2780419 RepID=UPI0018842078|nr:hypothetical protein [Dysgonomonas sp. GY75]MBF0647404.1 hypothetical protein [Dysgonomonas sp. GY75]
MIKKNNSQDKCDLNPPVPGLEVPYISRPGFSSTGAQSGTITGSGAAKYNADGSICVTGTKIFTSHVVSPGEDIANMVQFDAVSLLLPGAEGSKAL